MCWRRSRVRVASSRLAKGCPKIVTVPESAVSIPATRFSKVDLPAPLRPVSARLSPAATSSDRLWKTACCCVPSTNAFFTLHSRTTSWSGKELFKYHLRLIYCLGGPYAQNPGVSLTPSIGPLAQLVSHKRALAPMGVFEVRKRRRPSFHPISGSLLIGLAASCLICL